jgi:hypothetical protein
LNAWRAPRPRARLRGAVLGACVWLFAACGDDGGDAVHASLHGIVRDARSGKRLSGVEVEFEADTLETASDTTDSSGVYAMNVGAAAKNGRLTASKPGYVTSTVSAYLDDADVSIDISLNPQQ